MLRTLQTEDDTLLGHLLGSQIVHSKDVFGIIAYGWGATYGKMTHYYIAWREYGAEMIVEFAGDIK